MEPVEEAAVFFKKAENTLHDVSQKISHDIAMADVEPRQYISNLKDYLAAIKQMKEEALTIAHSFNDDDGLDSIVASCSEVMQLNSQLVAKTKHYLKHSLSTANGRSHKMVCRPKAIDTSLSTSAKADISSDIDDDDDTCQEHDEDKNMENEMNVNSEGPVATATEDYNSAEHRDSAACALSDPHSPSVAEKLALAGITQETLERLPLLKISPCVSSLKSEESSVAGRVPLKPCGNTPEMPVLSSLAQQVLQGGMKPK